MRDIVNGYQQDGPSYVARETEGTAGPTVTTTWRRGDPVAYTKVPEWSGGPVVIAGPFGEPMQIVALAEWDKLHADLAKLKAELAAAWEHNAFVVAREAEARKLLYRIKRQIDDMDGGALV